MSFICECITADFYFEGGLLVGFNFSPTGNTVGGGFEYSGSIIVGGAELTFLIQFDAENERWLLYNTGSSPEDGFILTGVLPSSCPLGNWVPLGEVVDVDQIITYECLSPPVGSCDCITIFHNTAEFSEVIEASTLSLYNGRNYYQYTILGDTFTIYWDGAVDWVVSMDGLGGEGIAFLRQNIDCPNVDDWKTTAPLVSYLIEARDCCSPKQERSQRVFQSVKLPQVYNEEDRGFFRCCCPFDVLASSGESWKNDITSAWIKLSSGSDTTSAVLYKNGVPTIYTPEIEVFPNDTNAFYWTIDWNDVLQSDGIGCYHLRINYNISGIEGMFTWGVYNVKPFSIENALGTARLRVKFNSYQEIEGINFTGANVEDTIRFHGFIGFRQPNMEIDNLIYKNREVKKVKRENLNTYEVITDPTCEQHIKKLTDLYLLSENELFISDYNAHNHSYRYQDLPAIVEESPEITYYDFSREASLKCIVGDKKKDKRSFYNGGLNLLSGPAGGQACSPASYVVQYVNGTPIQSGIIASGANEIINVPNPGEEVLILAHDFVSPFSYCGVAEEGSLASDEVWNITRIEVFLDGTTAMLTAENVAWNDRYIVIYS